MKHALPLELCLRPAATTAQPLEVVVGAGDECSDDQVHDRVDPEAAAVSVASGRAPISTTALEPWAAPSGPLKAGHGGALLEGKD